jgi:hypothetical protein
MKSPDYFEGMESGYDAGKAYGINRERQRQHAYNCLRFFLCIAVGAFVAHFIWALVATLV